MTKKKSTPTAGEAAKKRPTKKTKAAPAPAKKDAPTKRTKAAPASPASAKKPAKKDTPAKKERPAKKRARGDGQVSAALAPHGFPTGPGPGLCFREEDDALFALGFPHMRFLTDEPVEAEAAAAAAEKALDAIDPTFRLAVPRDIARRFLLGYRVGTGLFVDASHSPENAALREERGRFVRSDRAIDAHLLDETLEARCQEMGDTYGRWRIPKVLYFYERFIGAEAVARSVVAYLRRQAEQTDWPELLADPHRTNAAPHHVALALPWICRRLPYTVVRELRAELGALRDPDAVGDDEPRALFALLRWLSDPSAAPHPSLQALAPSLAHITDDVTAISARLDRLPNELAWVAGRACWLLGTERLSGKLAIAGHDLVRLVDQVAPIRDPGVVRLIATVATQRRGKAVASEWLVAHADHARPILESLARLDDAKERDAARGALALIAAGEPAAAPEELTEEQVEEEIARIFGELGRALRLSEDRAEQERLIRDAHERYTEARAAGGDPIPEAYFTHCFGEFGLGEWAMIAVDAIG